MFEFSDKFDRIENDELILMIIEKNEGDEVMPPFYWYDIVRKSDGMAVGKISVRIGLDDYSYYNTYYNGNIGYEIFSEYRGNGFACKACKMALEVAAFHGMEYVILTCDEDNIASYRTIENLGAELVEICDVPMSYFAWRGGMPRRRIYKLGIK